MSFTDETPIRESLLAQVVPLLSKHKGKHVVYEYDVSFQTWIIPGTQQFQNAWCLTLVVAGALVGRSNLLAYTWTFQPPDARPPEEREVELAVTESLKRLSLMQARQLQMQNPQAGGTSPN